MEGGVENGRSPHLHIASVAILVRDSSRPELAQPQYGPYPDDDDFVLETQQDHEQISRPLIYTSSVRCKV
jgi:hypothetical protein